MSDETDVCMHGAFAFACVACAQAEQALWDDVFARAAVMFADDPRCTLENADACAIDPARRLADMAVAARREAMRRRQQPEPPTEPRGER